MKKSKILIPALSIASVGAVVAPMVTSCTKAGGLTHQFVVDGEQKAYKTQVTPKTAGEPFVAPKTTFCSEATIAYWEDVKANPIIFADDVFTALGSSTNATYQNVTITVTNPTFNYVKLQGADVPLVSTSVDVSIEHKTAAGKIDKENATIAINNYSTLLDFTGSAPAIAFSSQNTFVFESVTHGSLSFVYNYVEDGVVTTDINLVANDYVSAETFFQAIKQITGIDTIIEQILAILSGKDSETIASSYFKNQTQAS